MSVSMSQVFAELKLQPSAFQSALLRTYASEALTIQEKAALAMATNARPIGADVFEWSVCCGRQSGKSSVIAPAVVVWTIQNRERWGVSAARPGTIVVTAPVSRQGKITLAAVTRAIEQHETLSEEITARDKEAGEIELGNLGVLVRVVPSNPRTARGNPTYLLLADEIDWYLADDEGNANWNDLYDAVRPGLVSFSGARVLKISSPAGIGSPMYADKERAEAGATDLVFFHASTQDMNPLADQKMIARERARKPLYVQREYDAMFLDSAGFWVSSEALKEAQIFPADLPIEELWKLAQEVMTAEGGTISTPVIAFDLANKGRDRCTYAIAARVDFEEDEQPRAIVIRAKCFERPAAAAFLDPRPCVVAGLTEAKKIGVELAVSDQVMAGYVFGAAQDFGIDFKDKVTGTESAKAHAMFAGTQALFAEGRILLPESEQLSKELGGLEDKFTRMKSNTRHDDLATACVAAVDEAVNQQEKLIKPWFEVIR
jgi:hypothetical protein